ncbi:Gramicidin S synthase 1 [Corynebacterium occultum]|uniref:Gramicidin S synthase 1 n=1 Tax=Corynebacterium occultum TaxID=2675219 RepID=A0A6B8VQ59_9CORY|nr:Pls/PosA family non-ribosomal peptide synthetase [Corynebacterium occultum]QGU06243.1 Gramicidin S synthase 1 [Corynebacterium occultum]
MHPTEDLIPPHRPQDHPELAVYGVDAPPPARTLVDIVRQTIADHPDTLAIVGSDASLTYRQLEQRLDLEVGRLRESGIGRGDRIGIRVPSGTTDLYVAILATIFVGAAYVPVDWDDLDSRARTVWEEADVAAVYGEDLLIELRHESFNADYSAVTLDDEAWIIFTSGSTGKPKGVAISHRSAAALVDAEYMTYLADAPLGPGDRVMAGLSVAFDASCEEMWLAWRNGATLVTAPRDVVRSGDALGQWIVDQQITAVSTVPTLASMWDPETLGTVRLLIFGGEACPLSLVQKLSAPGREVWNSYGPTEATVIATAELMGVEPPVRIGRPIPGWALAVVDPEGVPVAWGETGELIIAGVGLGRYLDPVKDAEMYAPLPSLGWERAYRTGDLVQAEQEGLIFAGRIDDQIKIGGRRLELGEVDGYLSEIPGVNAGAAAVHQTESGNSVLVGYLSGEESGDIDLDTARVLLARRMPGGIVPVLCVLDELPMKTSGKVDRKALPWPLPHTGGANAELPEHLKPLAQMWTEQLGPVPLQPDSDFFKLGGGSVAIARLAGSIRATQPAAEIGELYAHPTLQDMFDYLSGLGSSDEERTLAGQIPRAAGVFQASFVALLYGFNGIRYVLGALIAIWVLGNIFSAGWVPEIAGLPLLAGWLLLYSMTGKALLTAAGVRMFNLGLKPGRYRRGGWTHMRVWAAQRLLAFMQLENLNGTPMAPMMHRMMGNKIGRNVSLGNNPCVTGLVVVGDDVVIEHEVDLDGFWVDGDAVIINQISIGKGARVGLRTLVSPGVHIGAEAEILPGSHVDRNVPEDEVWGGSPLISYGVAGVSWPDVESTDPDVFGHERHHQPMNTVQSWLSYSAGLWVLRLLQVVAMLPGLVLVFPQVAGMQFFGSVFPVLAVWVPVFTILMVLTWLTGVVIVVRILAIFIIPGYFSRNSFTAFAVWLTHTLMQRTLISTYPIYASSFTPTWLRLLGARVGKDVEISTVETIPHLTWIRDRSFLADHSMASATRMRGAWLHIGTSVIGEGSFVGNSGIVGPDRDVADDSLVAVLSSTPRHTEAGTSWLGRTPTLIPRQNIAGDSALTYNPPRHLKVLRFLVECCRILPAMLNNWLDLAVIYLLTMLYMQGLMNGLPRLEALAVVTLLSWPVLIIAGTIASLIPVLVKWMLVGNFREQQKPLFSSFVWRGELVDVFVESLAIPSMIRVSLGSPLFNVWNRLMGAKIGQDVWCETWWLPEYDLVRIGDRASINRGTVLQTHLFHDRVMSMEPVEVDLGGTLGPNSFVLPGAKIGARSTVGPGSLVQRHEELPGHSVWQGNPVRHISEHDLDELVVEATAVAVAAAHSRSGVPVLEAPGETRLLIDTNRAPRSNDPASKNKIVLEGQA